MRLKQIIDMLQKAPFAYAYHQVIVDSNGIPVDYRFIEVNKTFETLTGLKQENIINKTVKQVIPDIVNQEFDAISFYGNIALNGGNEIFEQFFKPLSRWHQVHVYSSEKGYFSTIFTDITQRKENEQKLLESEAKLKQITDNITDVVFTTDLHFNTSYVSPSITRLTGDSVEEHLVKSLEQKHPATSITKMEKILQEAIINDKNIADKDKSHIIDVQYYKKDGSVMEVSVHASFIRNDKGHPIGVQGVIRDVSEQKKMEESIRLKSLVLDQITDHVTITDLNGVITYINDVNAKKFNKKKEDIIGKNIQIYGEDVSCGASQNEILDKTLEEGGYRCEVVNYDNEGKRHIMDCRTQLVYNEEGKPIALSGIATDITERKKMDEALKESEMRFKALHNASFGGIVIHDKGIILDCNQGLSEMTGYSIEELLGMDGLLLISPKTRDKVIKNILSAYEKPYEAIGLKKNGEEFPIMLEARQVPYKGKNVRTTEFRDITCQKRMEEELIDSEFNKAILENTIKAKQQFLANMSHEIRTPLAGVLGMIDVILESGLNNEQTYNAEIIKTSAESLLRIINDILDLSKIEAGKMELQPISFDFVKNIFAQKQLFLAIAEKKNIKIEVNVLSNFPNRIIADRHRINQVISNILSNAVKFTEKGSVIVKVSIEQKDKQFVIIKVVVKDTGIGIREKDKERVFDLFTQADSTKKKNYEGTGLGLAISKNLVSLMGGEIGLESKIGQGSTFWFTFKSEIDSAEEPECSSKEKEYCIELLKRLKVLLVDDNNTIRLLTKTMLQNYGITTDMAESGFKAIELIKTNKYDVILMDIMMPEMDGIETVTKIREIIPNPDMPHIICLTADAMKGAEKYYKSKGMDDYISKPVNEELFIEKLANLIRKN